VTSLNEVIKASYFE